MTVTKVKLSSDLRFAKIFVSYLDKVISPDELIEQLISHKSVIRFNMGNRLKTRFVPDIKFYYDDTLAYAEHIDDLIHKLKDTEN